MKLRRTIRIIAPMLAVVILGLVLINALRGIRNLPRARMETVIGLTEQEAGLNDNPLPARLTAPRIVISKSRRRLELYDGESLLRVHRVSLGRQPVGNKSREGDCATPEGTYYICTRNPQSRYHRFLGISYPNAGDAEWGLSQGLISKAEYDSIRLAHQQGRRPPWNTPLGGEIGIHGGGTGRDWTLGCIALTDDAIEELFEAVPSGTLVVIQP